MELAPPRRQQARGSSLLPWLGRHRLEWPSTPSSHPTPHCPGCLAALRRVPVGTRWFRPGGQDEVGTSVRLCGASPTRLGGEPRCQQRGRVPAHRETGSLCLWWDRRGLREGAWSQQVCPWQPTAGCCAWAALPGGPSWGLCRLVGAPGSLRRPWALTPGGAPYLPPRTLGGLSSRSPSHLPLGSLPRKAGQGRPLGPNFPDCGLLSELHLAIPPKCL